MPQLEGPATKIYNYVKGLWSDKAEKKKVHQKISTHLRVGSAVGKINRQCESGLVQGARGLLQIE